VATLWVLRDGEVTSDAEPTARGSLAELQKKFRLGDLAPLRGAKGAVSIGSPNSALARRRHAVLLLETHEDDMPPGFYAGRISA
jgi:hypothetical protein